MSVTIRKKLLSNGSQSLYLDVYHKGRRSYRFLELRLTGHRDHDREIMRLAETARIQIEMELFTNKHGLVSSSKGRISFANYCEAKGAGRRNLAKAARYIAEFDNKIMLESVDETFLEGFKDFLNSRGIKRSTASNYFHAVSLALNLAVKERAILINPAKNVKHIKVPDSMKEYLTIDEVQILAKTPINGSSGLGGEIKRAFLFSCYTGLRWSDLLSLTWGEIRENKIFKRQKKTEEMVIIPIHQSIRILINDGIDIHKPEDLVFKLPSTASPSRYIHEWCAKAGIQKQISFHNARHTAGTLLLEAGAEATTVQRILGHKKLEMTLQYARVTDPLKQQAINALASLDLGTEK